MRGITQDAIMLKYDIKQYEYHKIINRIVKDYTPYIKKDRVEQARIMERNIFDMIKNGKDVSSYITEFSRFCA